MIVSLKLVMKLQWKHHVVWLKKKVSQQVFLQAQRIYAKNRKAKELGKGKTVVTVLPSNGERYLSTPLYSFDD